MSEEKKVEKLFCDEKHRRRLRVLCFYESSVKSSGFEGTDQ